jgi:FkbM family methyltransferase
LTHVRIHNARTFSKYGADRAWWDYLWGGLSSYVESALLDKLLAKARVFYDVGSNWGYYSLLARTNHRFLGDVFAFDVVGTMSDELEKIITAASYDRVHVQRFGLSDTDGEIFISHERHAHLTRVLKGEANNGVRAHVRRLDGLDLPPPDLIKVDVEDHELAVFQGGQELIKIHRPAILMESRAGEESIRNKPLEFLKNSNYELFDPNFANGLRSELMLRKIDLQQGALNGSGAVNILALPEDRVGHWLS